MPDPHLGHVAHSISEPCIPQCPLYAEGGEARKHKCRNCAQPAYIYIGFFKAWFCRSCAEALDA